MTRYLYRSKTFVQIVLFLLLFSVRLAAQDVSNAQNEQNTSTAQGEQSMSVVQESHSAIQDSAQVAETAASDSSDISGRWYTNFFVSGGLQTFIPVSLLKEYTQAKPGYRAALGYTFFRSGKHTMPVYLETGHSVILGTNPLGTQF